MKVSLSRLLVSTAALSLSFVLTAGAAATGLVSTNALHMRSAPTASAEVLSTAKSGAQVTILSQAQNGWVQVAYENQVGYMNGKYLLASKTQTTSYALVDAGGDALNLRSGPSVSSPIVCPVPDGSMLPISGSQDGWYQVTCGGVTGYICADFVCVLGGNDNVDVITNTVVAPSANGAQIVSMAQNYLGCKYVYGATGPSSFDCSGLTYYTCKQLGISITRTSNSQFKEGTAISRNQLQAGDFVFFKTISTSNPVSHVGIYIGNGNFIHASTNQYVVRIDSLDSDYYSSAYVGARRVA